MTKGPQRRAAPVAAVAEPARGSLTIRLRKEVRKDIQEAAVKYGRSLSEEIENRLEVSFAFKQYIRHEWGEDLFQIAQAAASSLSFIENYQGQEWIKDETTYELFRLTISEIIRNYRDRAVKAKGRSTPIGSLDDKSPEEMAQMFAALGGLAPPRQKPKKGIIDDEGGTE